MVNFNRPPYNARQRSQDPKDLYELHQAILRRDRRRLENGRVSLIIHYDEQNRLHVKERELYVVNLIRNMGKRPLFRIRFKFGAFTSGSYFQKSA